LGRNRRKAGQKKRENQLSPCMNFIFVEVCIGAPVFKVTIEILLDQQNSGLKEDYREREV
jgi:hypothetical protein